MIIDHYYSSIEKSNFYLGMISQVNRSNSTIQVENLSLLNYRKIKLETLIPNTINYYVVIDSSQGLFIGEIYQSKVNSTDSVHESMNNGKKDIIFPEISIDVIGLLSPNGQFKLSGFKTVGITDKVYIANQELLKKYLNSIEINKYYLDEEQKISQSKLKNVAKLEGFNSEYLSLQPNTLFDRHLMVIGTTNSGKSTSALSILDKLVLTGRKILIIDPTGEYRKTFHDHEVSKYTLGVDTFLSTKNVSEMDWIKLFGVENDPNKASVLANAITSLKYQFSINQKDNVLIKEDKTVASIQSLLAQFSGDNTKEFNLSQLEEQIKKEAVKEDKTNHKYKSDGNLYNALIWLLQKISYYKNQTRLIDFFNAPNSNDKKLFEEINKFTDKKNKKSMYIDASEIGTNEGIGAVIVDMISNYLINLDISNTSPFILFVDEVHRYTKMNVDEQIGLTSIAREGRKKGIFLFLTTQNPKDVPEILLGQIGSLIIHRITQSEEIKTIQNHLQFNTLPHIQKLNQGEAIITSINLLRDIHVVFEKCMRKHNNCTPIL